MFNAELMLELGDLCHMGFVVPNMEKAMNRWRAEGARVLIEPTLDPIQNVVCSFLVAHDFMPIELVAPADTGNSPLDARLKKGGGLDHICRFSDDVEVSFKQLVERGAVPLIKPVFGCVWNRTIAFVYMPTGLMLELMSRSIVDNNKPDPLAGSLQA